MFFSKSLSLKVLAAATVVLLSSCGGGDDDEAGAPVAFNVVPEEFGYEWAGTSCGALSVNDTFVVNGGTAPYTVQATSPNVVTINTATATDVATGKVENKGGSFTINFKGGCTTEDGVSILVKDSLNRQVTVTVSSVLKE